VKCEALFNRGKAIFNILKLAKILNQGLRLSGLLPCLSPGGTAEILDHILLVSFALIYLPDLEKTILYYKLYAREVP